MANEPRPKPPKRTVPGSPGRPDIWAQGGQHPRLDLRALGRASLHLSRIGVAAPLAWAARTTRRVAVNVKNGAGPIPEDKLGRAARFVPSRLRVAGWIKTGAAVLAHASATADPDVKRGNTLVAEIEPHLWPDATTTVDMPPTVGAAPVVLAEPLQPDDDPLRSIRAEMEAGADTGAEQPVPPPAPPGQVATAAIQVSGYLVGWASSLIALPYGLGHALWLHIKGVDLSGIGQAD